MIRATQIADLGSAPLLQMETYWHQKRGDRLMPSRADIDPAEIKPLLPQIIMARIEHDPFRVRYSIVGTACARSAGFDYTGRYLDELMFESESDTDWLQIYAEIVRERKPIAGVCRFRTAHTEIPYRVGVFPLSSDGHRVDQTISYEHLTLSLGEMEQVLPAKPVR
ncbi:PAS domain-containing protein [Dongia sp.]|uniref:PAS domain-containing protein n=1 Tax=Dongia sp. TaxID=1977262 RepID=UPI0035B1998E